MIFPTKELLEETEKYLQSSLVSNQIRVVPVSYLEKVRDKLIKISPDEQLQYEKAKNIERLFLHAMFPAYI